MKRYWLGLIFILVCPLALADEAVEGSWFTETNGALPAGVTPIAVGKLPSGQDVYVCRAQSPQNGVAVGRLVQGSATCLTLDGKRMQQYAIFEVLAHRLIPHPGMAAVAGKIALPARRISAEKLRVVAAAGTVTKTGITFGGSSHSACDAALSAHKSVDAQQTLPKFGSVAGQSGAHVEEQYADGYKMLRYPGGSVVAPPLGAPFYCPYMVMMQEVPKGTPPDLPADDTQGLQWVRHHNNQLLDIIRKQVGTDQATFQQIEADSTAQSGANPFIQTDYLTGVATFYADNAP